MIRVLFDAHQLGRRQTGNETYVRELLRGLRDRSDLALFAATEYGQGAGGILAPPVHSRRVPRNGFARLAVMSILARQEEVDLVHAIYFLPPLTRRPTVLTVHDISFERFPEFFSRRAVVRDRALIRLSARAASRVVTVSETSRRDLIELYGLPEDRVIAIPNGVAPAFRPLPRDHAPYLGDRPLRVLAVGTLQPRKNLLRLVAALEEVARDLPVDLRVVGPDGHQAESIRRGLSRGVRAELLGWIDDEALAAEYRNADVFVYPSIYEGFGLPIVEAMASGTPVVTSTGGSLPEVAGDAALVVDPYDVHAMAAAIRSIAENPAVATGMRDRGFVRAGTFSWDRSAALHAQIYRDLLGTRSSASGVGYPGP